MRILSITPYFAPAWAYGGPVRVNYEVFRRLVQMGHQVTVFTTDVLDRASRCHPAQMPEDLEGIEVWRVPTLSNYLASHHTLFVAPRTRALLRQKVSEFDVLLLQDFYTPQNVWAAAAAHRARVPFIILPHGSLPASRERGKALLKRLFLSLWGRTMIARAAAFVAVSEAEKAGLMPWGVAGDRVRVIPNGVSLSEVENPPASGLFRSAWGIPDSTLLLLFAGRLHWIKGIDLLLEACASLRDLPEWTLVLAGPDEGFRGQAEALVAVLGLSDRVVFTGLLDRPTLLRAYGDADVFVLPSRSEGFPLTLIEAAAMGTYVVCTAACGVRAVEEWGAGAIVAPDASALAGALRGALTDADQREQGGRRGREMVRQLFTWERAAETYGSLLNEVVHADG